MRLTAVTSGIRWHGVRRALHAAIAVGLLAAACSPPAMAAQGGSPIIVGETHRLDYVSGDSREINVFLPADYDDGTARYPVLYLIDGGLGQDFLHMAGATSLNAIWGRSQAVIVVGIETKDRRVELIGSTGNAEQRKAYPTAGQAAQFRAFLRDQVKPLVEAQYRTDGSSAVIGESLAGLFIVETWLAEPSLFDRYAAIDPSLWWNDAALARSSAELVADGKVRGPIYLSYSNEGPETEKATVLIAKAAGERGCLVPRPDLTHATAYHVLEPQALQFLFPTDSKHDPQWGFEVTCSKRY